MKFAWLASWLRVLFALVGLLSLLRLIFVHRHYRQSRFTGAGTAAPTDELGRFPAQAHGKEPIIPFSGALESKLFDMPDDEKDAYCKEVRRTPCNAS